MATLEGAYLGFKGLKLILVGLAVLLISYKYERYLQTNKCPYCKADVPDEADICPSCYRSQFQYEGVSCSQAVGVASMVMLVMFIVIAMILPNVK